ncbi:diguanylate cyclase [Desulfosporosinus sp. PR]|uniref:sensor domain-containing diguanylate cyclase/phosphohydrolase n=1 Tax=Candidatus Desulfosporosinus nitrosoreducens TaxID=3401928 RepID=UPI0027E7FCBE|nr:HD domain-containing phosphohydrolase [Desulfosporosinus sp. PR]MDQ7097132.1 diguanylate cyclase [Desulfosporosinus sp. PR]
MKTLFHALKVWCSKEKNKLHKRVRPASAGQDEMFFRVFKSASVLMAIKKLEDCRYLDVNETFLKTLGLERGEVIGKKSADLKIYAWEFAGAGDNLAAGGRGPSSEISVKGQDGLMHTCIRSAMPLMLGETPCLLEIMMDISEHKAQEEELRKSEQKYKLLFRELSDAFSYQSIICDELGNPVDFRFINVNRSFEKMTGLKLKDIVGKTATEVFPGVNQAIVKICGRVALTGEPLLFNTFSSALNKYLEIRAYSPSFKEFATVLRDITGRLEKEKDIDYWNYHDVLTGLYNRRFYEEEIKRLNTARNLPISLIFGDVNGLKLINDVFGHLKGDELLKKAALAIRNSCRSDDIIARWGGDEFVILLPKTESAAAGEIVQRIRETFSQDYVNSINGSISFGWDTKYSGEKDLSETLKNAENMMYKTKTFETEKIKLKAIYALIESLHEKYPEARQHSQKVSELCEDLGRAIGLFESELCKLRVAGFFHDIGNISLAENILNKPEKLLEPEWSEIKRHTEIGYRILSSAHEMAELADYILAHHERWDGKGYPKGLQGNVIPLEARIIALVSSYVAMINKRPYRPALRQEEARAEILKNSGTQFDPELAKVFIKLLDGFPPF